MTIYLNEFYSNKKINLIKTREQVLDDLVDSIKLKKDNSYVFNYFFRLDLSNFFDSIDREYLFMQLRQDAIDESIVYLIHKIFYTMDISIDKPTKNGVPQGISISSLLAERYLFSMDSDYNNKYTKNQIKFIRYVDDIIILANSATTMQKFKMKIIQELQIKYSLKINENKINEGEIDNKTFEFLGIAVDNRNVSVSDSQYDRITNRILELFKWYKRTIKITSSQSGSNKSARIVKSLCERLNLLITGYVCIKKTDNKTSKYGWVLTTLPNNIEDVTKIKSLDSYISQIINKYIKSKTDKKYIIENKKCFYTAYLKSKYDLKGGYILNRELISKNEKKMYEITCNLSLVDIKHDKLEYTKYDANLFKSQTGYELESFFSKTLYITNRELCSDIIYW